MNRPSLIILAFVALLVPQAGSSVDYKTEIRPILNDKCYKCHSGPKAKGKLRMDSEPDFTKRIGGDDPVIVPNNPATSLLAIKAGLPRSDGDAMPPPPARARGAEALTSSELNLIRQWISEGAKLDANAPDSEPEATTAVTPAAAAEIHDWTNTSNVTIKAVFLSLESGNISLKTEAGEIYTFPASRLSPESLELAKKLTTP